MKKIILLTLMVLLLIPMCFAEQVLWDDDSNIEIYDVWKDIDGLPLTGATCSWQVYNYDGTLNQQGTPTELLEGVFIFTVNQLSIDIYPMLINCTKDGFNGTSTKDSIKIIDELSEEYKDRLIEINKTTHDIYDLLEDDMNITLTSILNLTDVTYEKLIDIESNISDLDDCCTSLTNYLEDKWGNEDADEIVERLKDIRSDVTYLRSRYYSLSDEDKRNLLLSIRSDSRAILNSIEGKDKWWEGLYILVIPILFLILLICLIVYFTRRKKPNEFGGDMNERR